ncbi:MAG: endonuclease, partial [Alphaproteobacteria bacterium]|nr:endonuclease [Alphaproteobacteria bacterium]
WLFLYFFGGTTLYCDMSFDKNGQLDRAGEQRTIEHVVPRQWLAERYGCENAASCGDNKEFNFAAADLHNLWPAIGRINSSRKNVPFGELAGEEHRRKTDICQDYERGPGPDGDAVVEPREEVKGDIARSLLYMANAYDLDLRGMQAMVLRWHMSDPPDLHERWRNFVIWRRQGTRNPYIDGRAHPK